jgi:hypothetical protein
VRESLLRLVVTGKCELCLQARPLLDSHFLPKALYRLMRDPGDQSPQPVLISGSVSLKTNYQMNQPLLCAECEDRFSKNGESYVIPKLYSVEKFPFLDRLRLAHFPIINTPGLVAFSCLSVDFNGAKIAYYGLSILWRAAVRTWRRFDGGTSSVVIDTGYLESMRQYMLGETAFPANLIVCATVATDKVSQGSCLLPTRIPENPNVTYSLTTRGLAYRFTFDPPGEMREICVASSAKQPIFIRDCRDKTLPAGFRLLETTVPKGILANES